MADAAPPNYCEYPQLATISTPLICTADKVLEISESATTQQIRDAYKK